MSETKTEEDLIMSFIVLPGFFRLERVSRAISADESVVSWAAGADPCPDGRPMGAVIWGYGSTVVDAINKYNLSLAAATEKAL